MDSGSPSSKPYTLYRPGGARPPRRPRRRRGLYLTLAVVALVAGLAGLAVAGALPWVGGGEAAAEKRHRDTRADRTPPSPTPTPTPSPSATSVTVVAGGDVIGDRSVRSIIASRGGAAVFSGIKRVLTDGDLTLVNLETPLTYGGSPQTWKDVVFKGDPRLAPALADAGVDVVTMANNHAGDQGDSGLLDSLRSMRAADVKVCGAGRTLADARAARYFIVDGLRVAFLGFTDVLPVGFPATSTSPGTSPGRSDVNAVKAAVRAAAKKADFVVVTWHWNYELTTAPSWLEASEGRAVIDAGADLVIGHHPHVLQGVQAYHGGFIAWSTGNLVFDRQGGACAQSMLVRAQVSDGRIRVHLVPVSIAYDGRPRVATGGAAAAILSRVKSYSARLGTRVNVVDGVGYVTVKR